MPSPIVYLNGRYMSIERASLPITDQGVLYGHGVFDTMRAYDGVVFRLGDHLDRLIANTDSFGIAIRGQREAIAGAIAGVLSRNRLREARIRVTVTAGSGGDGPVFPAKGSPNVFVTCAELPPGLEKAARSGYTAIFASVRRSSTSRAARVKATSYVEHLMARAEARESGADEALLLNEQGDIAEGATSNIFFVRRGTLYTPSLGCGILPGVTRKTVLELARSTERRVHEGKLLRWALLLAEEAFLTNAVIEVMPLVEVDGRPIGGGKPGPVTRELQKAYARQVREETGRR